MRRSAIPIVLMLTVYICGLTACGGGEKEKATMTESGELIIETEQISSDDTAAQTTVPVQDEEQEL